MSSYGHRPVTCRRDSAAMSSAPSAIRSISAARLVDLAALAYAVSAISVALISVLV